MALTDILTACKRTDLFAVRARLERQNGGGRTWGPVIKSTPDAVLFGGEMQVSDVSIEFDPDDFPNMRAGDEVLIDGVDYRVVTQPQRVDDGSWAIALLRVSS